MADAHTTTSRPLICPFCEAHELRHFDHNSARCEYCGGILGTPLLQTLQSIIKLPNAVGHHACECGHSGCPACGSEVLPISQRR
jgi:hypothetical protein